jgi:hypothetical protein
MKPISIKVIVNPESANKLSTENIRNLTISNSMVEIGKEKYDILEIESLTLTESVIKMRTGNAEVKFGVQTFGLKNVTDEYLTDLVHSWIQAVKTDDQATIDECISKIIKSKRSHEIRSIALLVFFPIWLIGFGTLPKHFSGWFGADTSHQTAIRLACGIYFIFTLPVWAWIFKKGDGFAFELNKKQNQNIDPTRKTPVESGND